MNFEIYQTAPKVYIQSDWDDFLTHEGRQVWVTFQKKDKKYEGKIKVSEGKGLELDLQESWSNEFVNLTVELLNRRTMKVRMDNSPPIVIEAPVKVFPDLHGGRKVDCLAVTDALGASSSSSGVDDNAILLWNADTGEVRRKLTGHPFDVTSLSFFPSGLVLLSASIDLKIWSCETGQCPRTLTAHRRPITGVAIVGRGKNVLSGAPDGVLNLWNCGSGQVVKEQSFQSEIVSVDIVNVDSQESLDYLSGLGKGGSERSEAEFETENKLVVVATGNGRLHLYHVASATQLLSAQVSLEEAESITSCKFLSPNSVICGCSDGSIHKMTFSSSSPLSQSFEHNVNKLQLTSCSSLPPVVDLHKTSSFVFVTSRDGCVSGFSIQNSHPFIRELTGPDCDTVYKVCSNSKHLFTAGRDGKVRLYLNKNFMSTV